MDLGRVYYKKATLSKFLTSNKSLAAAAMDAIKRKMQSMKVEKDNAMDRCDQCEQASKAAKVKKYATKFFSLKNNKQITKQTFSFTATFSSGLTRQRRKCLT